MKDTAIPHLPNSELELMLILWELGRPVTRADIEEKLREKQHWGATTILGFLSRLADKGFVSCASAGPRQKNTYSALISEDEYLEAESKTVLGRLCGRSMKNLVVHLYDNKAIGDGDLRELQAFIEEKRRKNGTA